MSANREYAGGPSARYLLLGSAVFLTVFGLVMVYSASSISALVKQGSSYYFVLRQLVFVGIGIVLAFVASRFDYRKFQGDLGRWAWGSTLALLIITYGLGVVRGGARRWIPLGFFNLQPSELAKIACVLVAAALAVEWQRRRIDTPTYLRRLGIFVGIPAVLIVFQPDLGTTILMALGVAIVLFLGGIELRWVYLSMGLMTAFGTIAIAASGFRRARVASMLDPWSQAQGKGYQAVQALLAFGTGGVNGLGLGLSRQKWFYLPEAHTDFIFAMIGEEAGLIGTLAVVAAFVILVYAGIKIAMGSRDQFGRLVAGALTGMLGLQAVLNMAAVTGLFPVTGKPLPFISYGGSSVIVTMISLGLILSVSQYGACAPGAVKAAPPRRSKEPSRASSDERRRDRGARVPRPDGRRSVRKRA
jgi:cell division protein FtsW